MQHKMKYNISLFLFACVFTAFFLADTAQVGRKIYEGGEYCIKRILPVLFPVTVSSEILNQTLCGKNTFIVHLIMGWIFGVPVCASGEAELYGDGVISKEMCDTLICTGSIPSIGFFLGVLKDLYGLRMAIYLYFGVIISSVITLLISGTEMKLIAASKKPSESNIRDHGFCSIVSESLKRASVRSLVTVGCVSFFYALSSCLTENIANDYIKALVFGAIEFSGGIKFCEDLSPSVGYVIASVILSFSGFSCFIQVACAAKEKGIEINAKRYFVLKAIQSTIAMIISSVIVFKNTKAIILSVILLGMLLASKYLLQRINRKRLKRSFNL